jgi:hypothetical protein
MSLQIADTYPAKAMLTESEAMRVLRAGPVLEWFRPWAEHARVAPRTPRPWGYVHIYGEWGEPPVWELTGYYSPDALAWGLELLYQAHDWHVLDVDGYLNDHECHGVFFWLPTDPRLLRLPQRVTR